MLLESALKPGSTNNVGSKLSPSSSEFALTFSPNEDIERAFTRLSAGVKRIIENSNFNVMQEACIEKALSPKNLVSENFVSSIEKVESFNKLCVTLAKSAQWNFLDTRMMEAMVTASMIPSAQQSMENFKNAFFGKKLDEVVPYYVPVIPLMSNHTILKEVLHKNPRHLTIAELHEHCFYLETELLETGRGTLSYYKIMVGSVIIEWQIHVDYVYQVHVQLKRKKAILSLQAISQFVIPSAIKWEGLPVIWTGQEVEQIGPIEPVIDKVEKKPYLLPKGFEWTSIYRQIDKTCQETDHSVSLHPSQWFSLHPKVKVLGITSSTTTMIFWGVLMSVNIKGKSIKLVQLSNIDASHILTVGEPLFNLLFNIAAKELMRQFQFNGIYQAIIMPTSVPNEIIKPIVTLRMWYFCFDKLDPLPYSTPQTAGLRKMTLKDIPSALALTNRYTSKFEIGHIFQSEEEFSQWFLPPSKEDAHIVTYVIEDPISGNITDMFSFQVPTANKTPPLTGSVIAIVNTKTPSLQLVIDLLLCAKKKALSNILTYQFGLLGCIFEQIFLMSSRFPHFITTSLYLYNYSCPEVDENDFVLFAYPTRIRYSNSIQISHM